MTAEGGATADVVVIGGGIVGLATAHRLLSIQPRLRVVLLEKEDRLGAHQTGHNSGVIHSGLYYRPGSIKARTAVEGSERMKRFCAEHGVRFEICGKVVVATEPRELPALDELHRRGAANGVRDLALIGPERLHEIEPHVAGLRALHVPHAGIVDFAEVARKLGELIRAAGGEIHLGARVTALRTGREGGRGLVVETEKSSIRARFLVNCAGLHSDRVARLEGAAPGARIVPFRGEYYELAPGRQSLVRALIYPVPDPRFPFLGVHFTRTVHGGVEAGPNAVLALSREGYGKLHLNLVDLAGTLTYGGFWRMAAKHWRMGLDEVWRSWSKPAFVRALQRLVPDLRAEDVRPAGSGVRAQALTRSGNLVDDFLLVERPQALHVCNAPSPAATASLSIADEIVRQVEKSLELTGSMR